MGRSADIGLSNRWDDAADDGAATRMRATTVSNAPSQLIVRVG